MAAVTTFNRKRRGCLSLTSLRTYSEINIWCGTESRKRDAIKKSSLSRTLLAGGSWQCAVGLFAWFRRSVGWKRTCDWNAEPPDRRRCHKPTREASQTLPRCCALTAHTHTQIPVSTRRLHFRCRYSFDCSQTDDNRRSVDPQVLRSPNYQRWEINGPESIYSFHGRRSERPRLVRIDSTGPDYLTPVSIWLETEKASRDSPLRIKNWFWLSFYVLLFQVN